MMGDVPKELVDDFNATFQGLNDGFVELQTRAYQRGLRDGKAEAERLRKVFRDIQWKIAGRHRGTSYSTCIGCGIVSYGTLSAPSHRDNCVVENVLRPADDKPAEET